MLKFVIVLIVMITFVLGKSIVQRNYVIEFTKVQCYKKSKNIKALECSLRNDSTHQYLIDGRLELASTTNDFQFRLALSGFRKNLPNITLYDFTLNGCEFLETMHKHRFLSVFLVTLKRYVNVTPVCPLQKDFNYTLNGFYYDLKDYPKYLPECVFKSTLNIIIQNRMAATTAFWGRVVNLKKRTS